eukprot:3596111-Prymnesium_polylepis.1
MGRDTVQLRAMPATTRRAGRPRRAPRCSLRMRVSLCVWRLGRCIAGAGCCSGLPYSDPPAATVYAASDFAICGSARKSTHGSGSHTLPSSCMPNPVGSCLLAPRVCCVC